MRFSSLFVTTVLMLGLTAWFTPRCKPPRPSSLPRSVASHDPLSSAGALRWFQGQPAHWRACLLQQERGAACGFAGVAR